MRTGALVIGVGIVFACSGETAAHSVVVHTGSVRWVENELTIQLDADVHTIEHEIKAHGKAVSASEMLERLARSVWVVGHETGPITIDRIDKATAPNRVILTYQIPQSVSAVALVHRPEHDKIGPLARQIQLRLEQLDAKTNRHLRLTSRGNHAVLVRRRSITEPVGIDPFTQPILRILPEPGSNGRASHLIQIDYPCTLLASWQGLIELDEPMTSGQQVQRYRSRIAAWANVNLSVINHTEIAKLAISEADVSLIDPHQNTIAPNSKAPLSILTTRIRISTQIRPSPSGNAVTLSWTGFNPAIARMPVLRQQTSGWELIGFLTPSQPTTPIPSSVRAAPVRKR